MLNQFFSLKNNQPTKIGANTHIQNQLHTLEIEKDILTKTISRLYDDDSGLSKIQRDRLLLRYQHQLGVIIARIEKLEIVSKHPDLGPLGEGLITLMDQKLSQLDQRLYELTSKIQLSQNEKAGLTTKETKPQEKHAPESKVTVDIDKKEVNNNTVTELEIPNIKNESTRKFEITTLTSVPKLDSFKQTKYDQMLAQLDSDVITPPPKKPRIDIPEEKTIIPNKVKPQISNEVKEEKPKQTVQLPEEPEVDNDDDDIEDLKAKIMKTMSKIEQAEVD
tara:strand:- start:179 stop:1009 length:831 start_codon:yes stop_codon:yes gene_type:complete